MKLKIPFYIPMMLICSTLVKADYSVDFVRVSCIPETRFFDIEYRAIHNNAVDAPLDSKTVDKNTVWAKHGFHNPSKLEYVCKVPTSIYTLTTTQGRCFSR